MNDKKNWRILAATVVFLMLGTYGCILNPSEDKDPIPPDPIVWPDLTEKSDCIETILILYNDHNRLGNIDNAINERYATLLYDDPNDIKDYVWFMSPYDQNHGYPEFVSRAQDIIDTGKLIKNISTMDFQIDGAVTWEPAEGVCEKCWSTTGTYSFTCDLVVEGKIESFITSSTNVTFIVGPHHNDPNKWAIYQISDLKPL